MKDYPTSETPAIYYYYDTNSARNNLETRSSRLPQLRATLMIPVPAGENTSADASNTTIAPETHTPYSSGMSTLQKGSESKGKEPEEDNQDHNSQESFRNSTLGVEVSPQEQPTQFSHNDSRISINDTIAAEVTFHDIPPRNIIKLLSSHLDLIIQWLHNNQGKDESDIKRSLDAITPSSLSVSESHIFQVALLHWHTIFSNVTSTTRLDLLDPEAYIDPGFFSSRPIRKKIPALLLDIYPSDPNNWNILFNDFFKFVFDVCKINIDYDSILKDYKYNSEPHRLRLESAFKTATKHRHLEILRLFVKAIKYLIDASPMKEGLHFEWKEDQDVLNSKGGTYFKNLLTETLLNAAQQDDVEIVEALIKSAKGLLESLTEASYLAAFNDARIQLAFIEAVKNGNSTIIKLLLEAIKVKVNVNACDNEGCTALMLAVVKAVRSGDMAVVKLLLEKGANVEALDKEERSVFNSHYTQGNQEIIALLKLYKPSCTVQ